MGTDVCSCSLSLDLRITMELIPKTYEELWKIHFEYNNEDPTSSSNVTRIIKSRLRYGVTKEDVDDILISTFINLMRSKFLERYDYKIAKFSTYLYRVVMSEVAKFLESNSKDVAGKSWAEKNILDEENHEILPEDAVINQISAKHIANSILNGEDSPLDNRQKIIISGRFGLDGKYKRLSDLSSELGISKERVRQIESASLKKLRRHLCV